jgi:hypothetical protein
MLPLKMEQVCQEKETVTVEAVKLAWEKAKGKVEIWKEADPVAQDEERAEERIPLMTVGDKVDFIPEVIFKVICFIVAVIFILSVFITPVLAVIFAGIDVSNQNNDSSTFPLFIIRLAILVTNVATHIILGYLYMLGRYYDINWPLTIASLNIFSFVSSMFIAGICGFWYVENGYESFYGATTANSIIGLGCYIGIAMYGIHLSCCKSNTAQLTPVKVNTIRPIDKEMANTIDAAVTVTRDWAANKSADLQKLLTADSQVDFKRVLDTSSHIENVIQTCGNVQKMWQTAASNEDPSIAAKQATEILHAIATIEGPLLEVERMLPQLLHHPDIQIV